VPNRFTYALKIVLILDVTSGTKSSQNHLFKTGQIVTWTTCRKRHVAFAVLWEVDFVFGIL
jgi:hypothetical protein